MSIAAKSIKKTQSVANIMFIHPIKGDAPAKIDLVDCTVEYLGEKRTAGLVTGVAGGKSRQKALESVARWNAKNAITPEQYAKGVKPPRLLMVDAGYVVDSVEAQRQRVSSESLAESGWMNMERLVPELREEVRAEWTGWMARSLGAERAHRAKDSDTSLLDLVLEYPQFIPNLFKWRKDLVGVLHPARPNFDQQTTLWMATVRATPGSFTFATSRNAETLVHVP